MSPKSIDPRNLDLWDELFETPPSQTKGFKGRGGFTGTAIKPYWVIYRATQQFGPVGQGWGWNEIEHTTHVHLDGQALWMSLIQVWYRQGEHRYEVGPQWGQTMLVVKRQSGETFIDEEAPKKAVTDGITKCLSYLGLGGDVHMGMFDDSKYVAEAKVEERKEKDRSESEERRAKKEAKKTEPEDVKKDAGNGADQPETKADFDPQVWRDRICADVKLLKTEKAVRTSWVTVVKPIVDKLMENEDPALREPAMHVHKKFQERLAEVRGEPK
jgi:hypothetical protein